jgi:hypothetical protein
MVGEYLGNHPVLASGIVGTGIPGRGLSVSLSPSAAEEAERLLRAISGSGLL